MSQPSVITKSHLLNKRPLGPTLSTVHFDGAGAISVGMLRNPLSKSFLRLIHPRFLVGWARHAGNRLPALMEGLCGEREGCECVCVGGVGGGGCRGGGSVPTSFSVTGENSGYLTAKATIWLPRATNKITRCVCEMCARG